MTWFSLAIKNNEILPEFFPFLILRFSMPKITMEQNKREDNEFIFNFGIPLAKKGKKNLKYNFFFLMFTLTTSLFQSICWVSKGPETGNLAIQIWCHTNISEFVDKISWKCLVSWTESYIFIVLLNEFKIEIGGVLMKCYVAFLA